LLLLMVSMEWLRAQVMWVVVGFKVRESEVPMVSGVATCFGGGHNSNKQLQSNCSVCRKLCRM
jgi:hypothetical protein